jgi:adenine-specific DNA-methyltransferase
LEKRHRIKPILLSFARELRHPLTPAEKKLWDVVRARWMSSGWKFRRQSSIGPFIADFYCAEVKLIVEVDGSSHVGREEYDARRTEWLQSQGYHVIRFSNQEVHRQLDDVIGRIEQVCEELGKAR